VPTFPRPRFGFGNRSAESTSSGHDEPDTPQVDVVEAHGLRWINLGRSGRAEMAWLQEHFDFHSLDYEDISSRNQRPKVDVYDDYIFVVLHFPHYDKAIGRLNALELDVFIGPDFVITIPNRPLRTIDYLFSRVQDRDEERERHFSRGPGYLLYRIVDECVDASFPMLRKIGNKLENLEEDIFEGRSKEIVREISNAKQEIINFRKIVRPQRTALKDLNAARRYLVEDQELYFDDINDASERVWDTLENFKEVAEALEGSNESVLAHAQSDSLKVLTAITVIVLPLTLIASVFGMNVGVPGEGSIHAFWTVVGAMVALLIGMLWFFRNRGWL
jgi:magnesium transporter